MTDETKDVLQILGFVLLIFIVWFLATGKDQITKYRANVSVTTNNGEVVQESNHQSRYGSIFAPALPSFNYSGSSFGGSNFSNPNNGSGNSGSSNSQGLNGTAPSNASAFFGRIYLGSGSAGTSDVNSEYLTLEASNSNTSGIAITGWRLQSTESGQGITIGKGAYIPLSGGVNTEEAIVLKPGDRAYIISGHSPISVSFRENVCTGYFNQSNQFYPGLNSRCPNLEDRPSLPKKPNNLDDDCLDYISSFPSCGTPSGDFPPGLSPDCKDFISREANYNSCITTYRNDASFALPTWHIYLGRTSSLWKKRHEVIELRDSNGKLVDSVNY